MSTMRRRGSSLLLDEAALGSAPLPTVEKAAVAPTASRVNPWRALLATGLMALSAFGGATEFKRQAESYSDISADRNLAEVIGENMDGFRRGLAQADYNACFNNVDKCPKYTKNGYGRLVNDWPLRHTEKSKCYRERYMLPGACALTCKTLFEDYLQGVEWGPYVTQACQVGCAYYDKFAESGHVAAEGTDCMWNCKNTVMNLDVSSKRCNWNIGLGIAVFNGEIGFGAGQACEMGCIIGGQRPSGFLERLTGVP